MPMSPTNSHNALWSSLLSGDEARVRLAADAVLRLDPIAQQACINSLVEMFDAQPPQTTSARIAAGLALAWLGDPRDFEALVEATAGSFLFGEQKEPRVIPKPFRIGRYPVTNAQYRRFMEATGHPVARKPTPIHWDASTRAFDIGLSNHPVVYVSRYDAEAYCGWLSERTGRVYRLPSEEEWERAARGTDGREWPWGEGFDAERANVHEAAIGRTTLVGAFPDGVSPVGALDMAGNVWEWTASDDVNGQAVLHGGSWIQYGVFARCASRYLDQPEAVLNDAGFRVVCDF